MTRTRHELPTRGNRMSKSNCSTFTYTISKPPGSIRVCKVIYSISDIRLGTRTTLWELSIPISSEHCLISETCIVLVGRYHFLSAVYQTLIISKYVDLHALSLLTNSEARSESRSRDRGKRRQRTWETHVDLWIEHGESSEETLKAYDVQQRSSYWSEDASVQCGWRTLFPWMYHGRNIFRFRHSTEICYRNIPIVETR